MYTGVLIVLIKYDKRYFRKHLIAMIILNKHMIFTFCRELNCNKRELI